MHNRRTGKRFPLELPITIRGDKKSGGARGTTTNLSAAALYMRADTELEPGSGVEFEIKLPGEFTGGREVAIACRGRVLRTEKAAGGKRGLACAIDSYDFARKR